MRHAPTCLLLALCVGCGGAADRSDDGAAAGKGGGSGATGGAAGASGSDSRGGTSGASGSSGSAGSGGSSGSTSGRGGSGGTTSGGEGGSGASNGGDGGSTSGSGGSSGTSSGSKCAAASRGEWTPMSTTGAPLGATNGTSHWWTGDELVLRANGIWHAYDPCKNAWRGLSTAERPTFAETYPADFDGKRLVIHEVFQSSGGDNPASFGYYDVAGDAWVAPSTQGMHTSANRAKVLTGDELLLWGGMDPMPGEGAVAITWASSNTGSIFDFSSGSWRAMSLDGAPAARVVTTTMYDFEAGKFAVWGGRIAKHVLSNELSMQEYDSCDPDTGVCPLLAGGGIYDLATDSWDAISEEGAPPPRNTPIVEWYEGKLLVLLGQSYPDSSSWQTFHDGGLYDPKTKQWTLFDGPADIKRPKIDGWPHFWGDGGLWISDENSGLWVLDPEALTFRSVPLTTPEGPVCNPFSVSAPVCRSPDGTSFLGFFDSSSWSWSLHELPAFLDEWQSPLEFWTGGALLRWGGQTPDPDWVRPTCGPSFPTCDVNGPPMIPNTSGGLYSP